MLPRKMLPRSSPDGIHIAFDDHRRVAKAGLILPATLALHLGLPNWYRSASTWATRRAGPTPATR